MPTRCPPRPARWARVTAGAIAAGLTLTGPAAAAAATDPDPAPHPQLMINGYEPIHRDQADLYAYVECADGRHPGPLRTAALRMRTDWYQLDLDPRGYWGKLTVINAAGPGRHVAEVDCGTQTVRTEFTIVDSP